MKKISLVFYVCLVLLSINATFLGFFPQVSSPGLIFVFSACVNLVAPGIFFIPAISILGKRYQASKKGQVLYASTNLAIFLCFIFLWVMSLRGMWSI